MLTQLIHGGVSLGLAFAPSAAAQDDFDPCSTLPDRSVQRVETRQLVLEGTVLLPSGAPAEGAVVVGSAGGQAVTGASGRFALEIEVAADVLETRLTAVSSRRGASLVASAQVDLFSAGGRVDSGRLELGAGSVCEPSWLPTFGGNPGVDSSVYALTVFDDGTGPALFAGGHFSSAGGISADRIAKWNGSVWSEIGSFLTGTVQALTVFDDGAGPALYAGGDFTIAGGTIANRIAKWNGSAWSALGDGLNSTCRTLAAYDDGTGPALFAGGFFTSAGGTSANYIAKWNGSAWSALGGGLNDQCRALTVYDDGSGPALFSGGVFTSAGGTSANFIAKWNGSAWSTLGSGLNSTCGALTVYDDGTGPALFAGGFFTSAGGTNANYIAKWNGSAWSALGGGLNSFCLALTAFDDGTGPALFAGGSFASAGGTIANGIARWDGSVWSALGSGLTGMNSYCGALAVYDDAMGPALFAGSRFTNAGAVGANNIAKWNGSAWSALGSGLTGGVLALTVFDDGTGPALFAGGFFTSAGGTSVSRISKWNGSSWSELGSGLTGGVLALTVFDDGAGPALFAGGEFTVADETTVNRIAKWDGSAWSALGSGLTGLNNYCGALAVYDDGTGPALFAGGSFTSAGGTSANGIAKWNGSAWSALGSGLNGPCRALTVYDDGTGPALFAGGYFSSAGGISANYIAKWDGSNWSALASGLSGFGDPGEGCYALTTFDEGTGPALFAGGVFFSAGATSAYGIARWDGSAWSALGLDLSYSEVYALTVYDDGTGPALYAGGDFTIAGGTIANRIAKWNGNAWSAFGSGLNSPCRALTVFDEGTGPALYAGGGFTVSPAGDSFLARWQGCPPPIGQAFCFGDGSDTACPCANHGATGEGCQNSTGQGALLSRLGSTSVLADDLVLAAMQMRPQELVLLFVGKAAVNGGNGLHFGDGLRCAWAGANCFGLQLADGSGAASFGPGLQARGGWTAGDTRYFQTWYRDPGASPCSSGFNLSHGYEVLFTD